MVIDIRSGRFLKGVLAGGGEGRGVSEIKCYILNVILNVLAADIVIFL